MSHHLKEVGRPASPLALPCLSLHALAVFTSLVSSAMEVMNPHGAFLFANEGEHHWEVGRASSLLESLTVLSQAAITVP